MVKSRVFRRTLTVEVFLVVSPGEDLPFMDLEAAAWDGLTNAGTSECSVEVGHTTASAIEELAAPTEVPS